MIGMLTIHVEEGLGRPKVNCIHNEKVNNNWTTSHQLVYFHIKILLVCLYEPCIQLPFVIVGHMELLLRIAL